MISVTSSRSVLCRMVLLSVWALCLAMSSHASAQSITTTYILDEVWLVPDVSHSPSSTPRQMTGTFEWTYEPDDFENGSGIFTEISTPWYDPGLSELNITVETSSIEFTLIGNYHDRGVDISLFLVDALLPDQPMDLDLTRSAFQLEIGVIYQGHIISGSVVPISTALSGDLDNDGFVGINDLNLVLGAWNQTVPPADPAADPSADGFVGIEDLNAVLSNWNAGTPPASSVPEPASLGLLALGSTLVMRQTA